MGKAGKVYYQDGEFSRSGGTELKVHRGFLLPVPKAVDLRKILAQKARARTEAKIALGAKRTRKSKKSKTPAKSRTKKTQTPLSLSPEALRILGLG